MPIAMKKPIPVQCIRYLPNCSNADEIMNFTCGSIRSLNDSRIILLRTPSGLSACYPGDWVLKASTYDCYPVTDAQFQKTYTLQDED